MRIPCYIIETKDGQRYYDAVDDCFYEYDGDRGTYTGYKEDMEELIESDPIKFRQCKVKSIYPL